MKILLGLLDPMHSGNKAYKKLLYDIYYMFRVHTLDLDFPKSNPCSEDHNLIAR